LTTRYNRAGKAAYFKLITESGHPSPEALLVLLNVDVSRWSLVEDDEVVKVWSNPDKAAELQSLRVVDGATGWNMAILE